MSAGLTHIELARQLTILELHLLSFVGPEEFIQAFIQTSVSKDAPAQPRQHEPKKTKNLEAYGKWFNRLNFLVATDILKVSHNTFSKFQHNFALYMIFCMSTVCKNQVASKNPWILGDVRPRMFQSWKFQFPHGYNRRIEYGVHFEIEKDRMN